MLIPQFNSVRNMPTQSKRAMLAALDSPPTRAKLAARNTLDYTAVDGARHIRLHQTDILTICPDGSFTLDTGGWNTHTTRDRLNAFLPAPWSVFTERGTLYLRNRQTSAQVPVLQTATISAKGIVRSDTKPEKDDKLRKLIDAYMLAFRKKGLPTLEQSGGDPWVFDNKVSRETMLDWLKSRYVFRLMYVLAFRWAGMSDRGIALYLHDADRRGGKLDKLASSRIRRYVRACMGLAA